MFWTGIALFSLSNKPSFPLLFSADYGIPNSPFWLPIWKTTFGGNFLIWGLFYFYSAPGMDQRNLKNRKGYQKIMDEVSPLMLWWPKTSAK